MLVAAFFQLVVCWYIFAASFDLHVLHKFLFGWFKNFNMMEYDQSYIWNSLTIQFLWVHSEQMHPKELMQWEFDTEAVVRMCSIKKLFLEISKNLQEDTCPRVSFSAMFYKKVLLNIRHNSQEETCVGVSFLIIKRDSANSALLRIL